MDNFDEYEREFVNITNIISRKIKQLPNFAGERKKVAVREFERELEEAEQLLQQMEDDANNDPSLKARALPKIKQYQADIVRFKKELSKSMTQSSNAQNREDLFGGATNDTQIQYMDQRQNLLSGTERLDQTSDRLNNTHRVALQSEQIGAGILGDLSHQRQQLLSADNRLGAVDDNVKRSRVILTGMARRVATNKLILGVIIILLIGANALAVYLRWFKP